MVVLFLSYFYTKQNIQKNTHPAFTSCLTFSVSCQCYTLFWQSASSSPAGLMSAGFCGQSCSASLKFFLIAKHLLRRYTETWQISVLSHWIIKSPWMLYRYSSWQSLGLIKSSSQEPLSDKLKAISRGAQTAPSIYSLQEHVSLALGAP